MIAAPFDNECLLLALCYVATIIIWQVTVVLR